MKSRLFVSVFSALMAAVVSGIVLDYSVMSPADTDIVFDYVSIGMVGPNHGSPFDSNGLYIGYYGDSTYQELTSVELPKSYSSYSGSFELDVPLAYASNYFILELYDGVDVVAYSDLVDYDTFVNAKRGQEGWQPLSPMMYDASVPEPSSGLLLLIGGALVGLRRKRRAA